MAKKVRMVINKVAGKNISNDTKKTERIVPQKVVETKIEYKYIEKKLFKYIAIVSIIINFVLVIVVFDSNKSSEAEEYLKNQLCEDTSYKDDKISDLQDDLDSLTQGHSVYYTKEKLRFMDENIIFRIKGFGNYYYSYDCMMDKVDGEYTYWAYNKEQANDYGYIKGRCN